MPETYDFSPNPPENPELPGSPESVNIPSGENRAEPSTSAFEKIGRAASAAFSKISGSEKRGRGRPKNCVVCGEPETKCQCKKVADLAGSPPPQAGSEVDFEAEIVTMLTDSVISGGAELCNSKITEFGVVLGEEKYCEDLVRRLTPDEAKLQKIGKLTHIVLKKHEVSTKYLAEAVLAVSVLNIAVGYGLALRTLAASKHRKDFPKTAAPIPKN